MSSCNVIKLQAFAPLPFQQQARHFARQASLKILRLAVFKGYGEEPTESPQRDQALLLPAPRRYHCIGFTGLCQKA